MSMPAENLELKALLESISTHTGSFSFPSSFPLQKVSAETLKILFTALMANSNIDFINLYNLPPDQKATSEVVNSEEFYKFLMEQVKTVTGPTTRKLDYLLDQLGQYLELAQDKVGRLKNTLVISTLQKPYIPSETPALTITLNYFVKHPEQLTTLKEAITQYNIELGWCLHSFKINIEGLSPTELAPLLNFLNSTHFQSKVFGSLVIEFKKVEDEYKRAMELLSQIQNPSIRALRFEGGSIPFELLKPLTASALKTSWLRKLELGYVVSSFKDSELLELAQWLKEGKHLSELNFGGAALRSKSYSFFSTFVGHILNIPRLENLDLWWDSEHIAWSPEEQRDFANLAVQILSKVNCFNFNQTSPFAELVSKQEECDLLCKILKENPMMSWSVLRWIERIEDLSDEQRYQFAETYFKAANINHDVSMLKKFNLSKNDRLKLFISAYGEIQTKEPLLASFGSLDGSEETEEGNLDLYDSELPYHNFIDAWKTASIASDDEAILTNPDAAKIEIIEKLIPALQKASQEYWGNSFYEAPFKQITGRAIRVTSDPFSVFRWAMLLQWYTWTMCYLARLKEEGVIQDEQLHNLSPFLKEIAGYADPKMRYILSETLFTLIKDKRSRATLFSLTQKDKQSQEQLVDANQKDNLLPARSFFLPEIFLCKILSQNSPLQPAVLEGEIERKDSKEWSETQETQETHLKLAKKILSLLSSKYDNGHYMRSFISALSALSKDVTLSPEKKLQIVHNLLENSEYSNFLTSLDNFFNSLLKAKQVKSSDLNTDLRKLLDGYAKLKKLPNDYADLILADFKSRYFEKDKFLDSRALRAIARGVQDKVSELEHKREFPHQISHLYLVEGLSLLSEVTVLSEAPATEYKNAILNIFKELFKVDEEAMRFYQTSIGNNRNESAILTYLGKIRSLSDQENSENLENIFTGFVKSILTENQTEFYKERYNTSTRPHLKIIFDRFPHLKEMWSKNHKANFNEFLAKHKITYKPFKMDYVKFLRNKIYDNNHLNGQDYPELKQYLDNISDEKIKLEIKERLTEALKKIKETEKTAGSELAKRELRILIQLELIHLTEDTAQESDPKTRDESEKRLNADRLKCLNKVETHLRKLSEGREFLNDLSGLLKSLMRVHRPLDLKLSQNWTVTLTDHYWDMLMSGTDIEGSCQRIDGDPELNRCLTAYIGDGKCMMFAIKEGEKILARRIVRLMWDEIAEIPVLYLEETYPITVGSEQEQAIELFAKFIAEDLGLTLVSDNSTEDAIRYPNPLVSKGGVGAPEYVDAIHAQAENGIFTIPNSYILFKPSPKATMPASLHFNWKSGPGLNTLPTSKEAHPGQGKEASSKKKDRIPKPLPAQEATLGNNREGRQYWYYIQDGMTLLQDMRQQLFTYNASSGTPTPVGDPSGYRENKERCFSGRIYHSPSFSAYLEDDVNVFLGKPPYTAWQHKPTRLIFPVLSGAHWRNVVLDIDYDKNQVNVLWDDPFGPCFPEALKVQYLEAIKNHIPRLMDKKLASEIEIIQHEKAFDQQGLGKNGYDCGPIVFQNLRDYARQLTIPLSAFARNDLNHTIKTIGTPEHSKKMGELRHQDKQRYLDIHKDTSARPVDLKQDYEQALVQQWKATKTEEITDELQRRIGALPSVLLGRLITVLQNHRLLSDAQKKGAAYTQEELEKAYEYVHKVPRGTQSKETGFSERENRDRKESQEVSSLSSSQGVSEQFSAVVSQLGQSSVVVGAAGERIEQPALRFSNPSSSTSSSSTSISESQNAQGASRGTKLVVRVPGG